MCVKKPMVIVIFFNQPIYIAFFKKNDFLSEVMLSQLKKWVNIPKHRFYSEFFGLGNHLEESLGGWDDLRRTAVATV